jgi:hypothetical protein
MEEKKPFLESFLDNPIGLLIMSLGIFAIAYFIWGIIIVLSTPPLPEAFKISILGGE